MPLNIEACWSKPVRLTVASAGAIYDCKELDRLPAAPGVYIFYRQHGDRMEPLYVGKSMDVRNRVTQHLDSVRLMTAIYESQAGGRYVICCEPKAKPGQKMPRILTVLENALIDYAMAEGYELKQKQGTKRPNHQIKFSGNRTSEALVPRQMRVRV
ncbi:MAG TPA: hypothetical protein VK614_13245 [Allosphingosinicella sp.]|nr:hypothetical protein [Allosphingosinicella sp.]